MDEKQKKLVEEHLYLIHCILKDSVYVSYTIGLEYDDLYQEACIGLMKAAKHYNGSVKFTTYARKVVKNHLISHFISTKKVKTLKKIDFISIDSLETSGDCMCKLSYRDEIDHTKEYVNKYLQQKMENTKGVVKKGVCIIHLRMMGYKNCEIAREIGVKNNLVSAWLSKATKEVKPEIMRLTA